MAAHCNRDGLHKFTGGKLLNKTTPWGGNQNP